MILFFLMFLTWPDSHAMGLYGPDNRMEIADADIRVQELSRSTPALIQNDALEVKEGRLKIKARTLGETDFLCKDERFKDQIAAVDCSGTLVGDDLILTASHCYKEEDQCSQSSWVFDYKLDSHLTENEVYRCKEVALINEERDFAIIRLDRKVKDRKIISLSQKTSLSQERELVMIGYPRGIPMKATDQGFALEIKEFSFITNLDAYLGNSGSGVFDRETLELKGILSKGGQDYLYDGNKCVSSYQTPMEKGEEEVMTLDGVDLLVKGLQSVIP